MSTGKFYYVCESLFSGTSRSYESHDRYNLFMINDFPEFDGQQNIEEVLDWVIEVERFFKDRNIAVRNQVKIVARKLKGIALAWWEQLQRMRTRLGKYHIQNWEKMKKYLKRKFLPADYQEFVYQIYENCKQLGNSVSDFTKEFYCLQLYLDFNESEAYNISRYMMGFHWVIRKRLSTQPFYYLTDFVLAATRAEKLMEKERKELWKTHREQGITTENSTYTTVSKSENATFRSCNPGANTPSIKASADHMGRDFSISSKAKTESDAEAIKEKDHMSDIREEQEQLRQSVLLARYDIQRGVCHLVSDSKTCDNLVSALEEKGGIDDRTLSRATQKGSNSQDSQQQSGDTALSQHAVIINDKTEHCSSWTNVEAMVYMLKKREPNPARSTTVIAGCIQDLITDFLPIQEKLKILNPVRFIRHDIDQICSRLQNLSPINAHMSGILLHVVNEISSTTLINKNITARSLAPYLFPNRNQSRKTFIQNQTIESPLKVGFPIPPPELMLDLLCGSSLYLKIYLDEQDHHNAI